MLAAAIPPILQWSLASIPNFMISVYGAFGVFVAGVVGVSNMLDNADARKAEKIFNSLDKGTSRVFNLNAKPGDVSEDFYKSAQKAYKRNVDNRFIDITYDDEAECEKKHPQHRDDSYLMVKPVILHIKRYSPYVAAFQTATDDPKMSVPLYVTHDPNVGMRGDGKLVSLDI